ncbi:putative 16S rRNA methyltransferase GidB, partial [[Clostridium] hylemonae DSM 15053]
MSKILKTKLQELNISINDRQEEQFEQFYDLLIEWNKVMNLTGITEYEEVVEKHFVDSLSLVKAIEI